MRDVCKLVVLALTAAYVALLPQFYEIFDAENRFTLLWNREYHAAIATAVAALGLMYGLIYAVLFRAWRPSPLLAAARDVALVVVLLGVVTRSAVAILDRSGQAQAVSELLGSRMAKIVYYLAIPLLLAALNPPAARRRIRGLYWCLSPMMFVGLLSPLAFATYDVRSPPIPTALQEQLASTTVRGTTNVYIFMLDEWSYERTFPGGQPLPEMPRLGALLRQATLYRNARAPGPTTAVTIPRFLFQNNPGLAGLSYDEVRQKALSRQAIPGPSLFSVAPENWYRLAIGFWIDYPALLGTNIHFGYTIHQEAGTRTYGVQALTLLATQFHWLRLFGVDYLAPRLDPSLLWIYSQEQAHRWARQVIERVSQPTVAYFHYCLPHHPYVWTPTGRMDMYPDEPAKHTAENYHANLVYLDHVLGEVIDAMEEAGKFDSSMLILTSDHSWRYDPAHPEPDAGLSDVEEDHWIRHVPLIVKRPHQNEGYVVDEPVRTADVHAMIRDAIVSRHSPRSASAK